MKQQILKTNKPPKLQRVQGKDAKIILEKLISNFQDKMFNATTYEEDYAGGSRMFINSDIIDDLIKKLTR